MFGSTKDLQEMIDLFEDLEMSCYLSNNPMNFEEAFEAKV